MPVGNVQPKPTALELFKHAMVSILCHVHPITQPCTQSGRPIGAQVVSRPGKCTRPGTAKYEEAQAARNILIAKQIAEMIAEYKALESPAAETLTRAPLLERNVNVAAAARHESNVTQYNRDSIDDNVFNVRANDENNDEEIEDDSTSLSSYTPSSAGTFATPLKKPTKSEIRAQKKAKKSAKSQTKALRNQNRNLAAVTSTDVKRVATTLHGDESDAIYDGSAHPLATDKAIEDVISRNLNFVKNIQVHKQCLFQSVAAGRKENKERKRLKKRESRGETMEDTIEMEEVVSATMIRLGVSPTIVSASSGSGPGSGTGSSSIGTPCRSHSNATTPSRTRASFNLAVSTSTSSFADSKSAIAIATRLRAAINTDLEKHENEVHARYIRAGGFWRYVGKTVFERMTEVAAELDVGSGERWEKKRAREGRTRSGSDGDDAEGVDGAGGQE